MKPLFSFFLGKMLIRRSSTCLGSISHGLLGFVATPSLLRRASPRLVEEKDVAHTSSRKEAETQKLSTVKADQAAAQEAEGSDSRNSFLWLWLSKPLRDPILVGR